MEVLSGVAVDNKQSPEGLNEEKLLLVRRNKIEILCCKSHADNVTHFF